MAEKQKKPFYKRKLVWAIAIVLLIVAVSASSQGGEKANETVKSVNGGDSSTQESRSSSDDKPRLTLDDGWAIDTSNPYMTQVVGTVSNNSDRDITGYIQITFSALDSDGANVGDCLANANTVDANGKWKFKAMCSGDDIQDVRFKDITGF